MPRNDFLGHCILQALVIELPLDAVDAFLFTIRKYYRSILFVFL